MKKYFFLTAVLLTFCTLVFGQKKFPKITPDDFQLPAEASDTSIAAVCIYDIGKIDFVVRPNFYAMETEVKVRIQILTERGKEYANQSVAYHFNPKKSSDDNDHVTGVSAASYNLVNGKVVKTSMSGKYEFDEQVDDNTRRHKFTIPDVKVGSIIEYKYTIASPRCTDFPSWVLQRSIPVRYSYCGLTMPDWYKYHVEQHGAAILNVNQKSTTISASVDVRNTGIIKAFTYEIEAENMKAFKKENHLFCPNDYIQRVDFELLSVEIPGHLYKSYTQTWNEVRDYLREQCSYDQNMKIKNPFAAEIASLQLTDKPAVVKASRLFAFLKEKVKWDKTYRLVSKDPLKAARNGKGSNADLNFIYMSMLRDAGINACPMMVPFRSSGRLPLTYASIDKLNTFVVAFVDEQGSLLFADCSSDYGDINILPVGLMSEGVLYNPHLIANSTAEPTRGEIFDLANIMGNSMKVNVNVALAGGEVVGQRITTRTGVNAMLYKERYNEKEDSLSFIEEKEKALECKIKYFKARNADGVGSAVEERIRFTKEVVSDGDRIYLNPIIFADVDHNSFTSPERELPVEFGMISDDDITSVITLTDDYEVEEIPQSKSIELDNYLSASISFEQKERSIVTHYKMRTDATFVPVNKYAELREFWNELVKMNTMMICIKKKQ